MSGRGWGGFSCRLTRTSITAEAEPSAAPVSAEPGLRARVGDGAAGGRCRSLGPCRWDATESLYLVGFCFQRSQSQELDPLPGRIRLRVEEAWCPSGSKVSPAPLRWAGPCRPLRNLGLLPGFVCRQAGFEGLVMGSIGGNKGAFVATGTF